MLAHSQRHTHSLSLSLNEEKQTCEQNSFFLTGDFLYFTYLEKTEKILISTRKILISYGIFIFTQMIIIITSMQNTIFFLAVCFILYSFKFNSANSLLSCFPN